MAQEIPKRKMTEIFDTKGSWTEKQKLDFVKDMKDGKVKIKRKEGKHGKA